MRGTWIRLLWSCTYELIESALILYNLSHVNGGEDEKPYPHGEPQGLVAWSNRLEVAVREHDVNGHKRIESQATLIQEIADTCGRSARKNSYERITTDLLRE